MAHFTIARELTRRPRPLPTEEINFEPYQNPFHVSCVTTFQLHGRRSESPQHYSRARNVHKRF